MRSLQTGAFVFAAPSRPPTNLTGDAPSSSSVRLSWKPVDEQHINGILRAYVIIYFVTQSPEDTVQNISIPVTGGRRRRAISNPSSPSLELNGLKKFTGYTIQVLAYTVDYGVPSHEVNVTTGQDGNYAVPTVLTYKQKLINNVQIVSRFFLGTL